MHHPPPAPLSNCSWDDGGWGQQWEMTGKWEHGAQEMSTIFWTVDKGEGYNGGKHLNNPVTSPLITLLDRPPPMPPCHNDTPPAPSLTSNCSWGGWWVEQCLRGGR